MPPTPLRPPPHPPSPFSLSSLSLRGKKHVKQALNKLGAADKAYAEKMRYYNGLALSVGATKCLEMGFNSDAVREALWPSSAAPADGSAAEGSSSSEGSGALGGAAPAQAPAAAAPAVFATAPPAGSIPGIRSAASGAHPRPPRPFPRTMEDSRQPVAMPSGALVFPEPSPHKGRRRPAQDGEQLQRPYTSVAGPRAGPPPPCGGALLDHIVVGSAGLSTVEGAGVVNQQATQKRRADHQQSCLKMGEMGLGGGEGAAGGEGGGRLRSSKGAQIGGLPPPPAPLAAGVFNRAGMEVGAVLGAHTEARYMRTCAPLPKGGKLHADGGRQQQGADMAAVMRG